MPFEDGKFLLRVFDFLQPRLGDDGLAEGGGGLGQRHGRILLEDGLVLLVGAFVVEGVTEFVRDGGDLVSRTVEVDEDAALLQRFDARAISAGAFALAHFRVQPVFLEGALCEGGEFRREVFEVLEDEVARFLVGDASAARADGRVQVVPGEFVLAEQFGFVIEIFAEEWEGIFHGRKHRVERRMVNARLLDGRVERVRAAAAFVERDHLALDAVQRGGQRLADRVPGFVLGFVGAAADVAIGMGAQVDQRGHG